VVRLKKKKTFSTDKNKAAVVLWKARLPLKNIMVQAGMSKTTLKRVLAFNRDNVQL
jgi:hypothetical protein